MGYDWRQWEFPLELIKQYVYLSFLLPIEYKCSRLKLHIINGVLKKDCSDTFTKSKGKKTTQGFETLLRSMSYW